MQPGDGSDSRLRPAAADAGIRAADRRRVSGPQPRQEAHRRRKPACIRATCTACRAARCDRGNDEMLARLGLTDRAPRSGRNALGRTAAPRRAGQGHAPPAAAAAARRAEHRPRSRRAERPVELFAAGPRRGRRDGRADDAPAGRGRTRPTGMAILNAGSLVALDTPDALRATVGGDSITIETAEPRPGWPRRFGERFGLPDRAWSTAACGWSSPTAIEWIARLVEAFPGRDRRRSRSASRRWKTCSSTAPGTASGTSDEASVPRWLILSGGVRMRLTAATGPSPRPSPK